MRLTAWFVLSLCLCVCPAAAVAATTPDVVQRLIAEGQSRFKGGAYAEALALFQKAARSHPDAAGDARLQWNIARSLEELDRFEEALRTFELTMQLAEAPDRRQRAADKVATLRARHFGRLTVECAPGGRVRLEGLVGERACPATWDVARSGVRRGTAVDAQGRAATFEIVLQPGQSTVVRPVFDPPPEPVTTEAPGDSPWPWVAVGVGAAALAGSWGMKLYGDDLVEEARVDPDPARYDARRDAHAAGAAGHYALLGIGATLVLTGGVLWWLDGSEELKVIAGPGGISGIVRW